MANSLDTLCNEAPYFVIEKNSLNELLSEVNKALTSEQRQCNAIGGVAVYTDEKGSHFLQAVVLIKPYRTSQAKYT